MEEKTMKRATLVLLALLLVVACAPKGMKLVYNTQSGTPIKTEPVYLKIKDVRNDKMLVSSAVMRADKFTNVGDRFSLTAQGTGGRTVQLQNVTVSEAFQEAFRLRLQGLGVGLLPDSSQAGETLVIEVEKFQLDLAPNRTFTAAVDYTARFFKGAKQVHSVRISGSTEKFYVIGQSSGEEALSEAFSSAVNSLELEPLTR
jgi:hypothetical protein